MSVHDERIRKLTPHPPPQAAYVLYWMRTAVRGTENPALDVAIEQANQLGIPVFVYHAVSERYPFASDRHHTFILEGAQDVAQQLSERGIATAFHCERPGHRGPHLRTLAERAALVVTEEMPVSPLREWTRALADGLEAVPVWAVDTACIVPMRTVGKGLSRAYAYRRKAERHLERCLKPWPEIVPVQPAVVPDLPFTPIDWETIDIPTLVAACAIDHTVASVPDTPGGSKAGYARWDAFRTHKLRSYARQRNDPNRHATSRLSAYLHYGMVAPTRIAREAIAQGSAGAEKFIDELFVWRELAYTWCLYNADHDGLGALPDWSRSTLQDHASDPREAVFSLEQLQRSRTGHPLWDLAQTSLRVHGELHNNVRMSWGKALLSWTSGPEEALRALVDLNHRYALDGRDPASYGGLLWCMGQFDRPFPESPVTGTVRGRSLDRHTARLDLERWARHVHRPRRQTIPHIAVIGGGPAGALCARTLADHGLSVVVFDKARGAGGRTSTRRVDDLSFDLGAQYFTAQRPELARHLTEWQTSGLLAEWKGPFGTYRRGHFEAREPRRSRLVAQPGMNALVKHLLSGLEVRFGARVTDLQRTDAHWAVTVEQQAVQYFDGVVVAVPAPQAIPLLGDHAFAARLGDAVVHPCWTVLATAPDTPVSWSGTHVEGGALGWMARNQTKPGRHGPEQWVLQATPDWSAEHLEEDADAVLSALVDEASTLTETALVGLQAHRWRYAQSPAGQGPSSLYDAVARLGVCGDAGLGSRLENALASGAALAGRLLSSG